MVSSLLALEIIGLIFLKGGILILYLYIDSVQEKNIFWERINKLKKQNSFTAGAPSSVRPTSLIDKFYLSRMKDLLRQTSADTAKRYRLRFEQAGWDPQEAPLIVSIVNLGLIILGFFLYLFLAFDVKNIADLSLPLKVVVFCIIIFASMRSFEYFIDFVISQRYDRVRDGLAYAIDLMSICTRSGFGLEKSFEKIAEEMSQYNKDLCKEFTKTSLELSIIPERTIALRNLAQRVNIPVMQILASGLIQAEEQGASLSNTLRMMSVEFSKQKMLEIEAKATKLPALLTLPLILFLLPAMMIVLMGPAIASLFKGGFFG